MKVLEKLLDYVSYETTSDPNSDTCPSSGLELELGKHLVDELLKYGCSEAYIDKNGYVYGTLPGDDEYYSLGLVAHMDTSFDASGKNVKPRVIEKYDGNSINLDNGLVTSIDVYPFLKKFIGKTLVVSDGNTLLGADDKAGVAIIMEIIETLKNDPSIKHGTIKVCITPDEEIGRGADLFNYDEFKVDFCYTIDGSDYNVIAYENFNAASALVNIKGVSVHPGSAKDKMINAINVAHEFHDLLDHTKRPEHTEGYEGFIHAEDLSGRVERSKIEYIIRSFDLDELENFKKMILDAKDTINKKYGKDTCFVGISDQYRNMKEAFKDNRKPIDLFFNACKTLNIEAKTEAIRGGTDGARFSLEGLPCPNLGTGGENFHGPHELWCKQDAEQVVNLLLCMIKMMKKNH